MPSDIRRTIVAGLLLPMVVVAGWLAARQALPPGNSHLGGLLLSFVALAMLPVTAALLAVGTVSGLRSLRQAPDRVRTTDRFLLAIGGVGALCSVAACVLLAVLLTLDI
jgi:hypothetical protein